MADETAVVSTRGKSDISLEGALAHVMDGLPDAVLLLDESCRILYANQAARRISHIQPETLNRETVWELFPQIVGTNLQRAYREAMTTRTERAVDAFYYEPFKMWFDFRILPTDCGVAVHFRDVTDMREADPARDASAEQLQQVLEATTDCVLSLDRDWRITYLNQRAREVVSPTGEVVGKNLWESIPHAIYEGSPYVEHCHRAMNEGLAGEFEAFYPDPLNIWLHVIVRPARDGIILFFRDVTERRGKEDALRASQERYRVLAELNPQALWTADVHGHVWYANQTFLDYIGKDFVPRDGTEYLDCFYEGDRERVLRVWSRSLITGEEYEIDARLVRASDGAVRWWHLRALPVRDHTGAIYQWLGTAVDVHDPRMAAERLRQQYALVESSRDFIGLCDMQGTPIYGNRAALQLVGLDSLADFTRTTVKEFFFPEDQDFIVNEFLPNVLREGHGEVEVRFRHFKTSEPIWMNYHVFLLRDVSGEPVAYATVSRDMTAQKRAEASLIQTEKLAAVGRLASSIAHEINNPLESVTNLIFLARRNAVDPPAQKYLDAADHELRRVSIIVNQTLRFHKQATKPQAIACSNLYSTVLSIYEGRLRNSNVKLEKRKRANTPVVCFEGEIRQVLNNLVSNAIDAMPRGGRLLVRSRDATDWRTGRRGVVLTVADTGSGIDAATQARMFQAFFTTKDINGTGLGLWVSAEIMERHQGRIRVRSSQQEAHKGTVISLFLPFETIPVERNQPARA